MNAVAKKLFRPPFGIHRRQRAKQGYMHNRAGNDLRDRRTAGNFNDRLAAAQHLAGGAGVRRIGLGRLNAAPGGAGANFQHCHSAFGYFLNQVFYRPAAHHAADAVIR